MIRTPVMFSWMRRTSSSPACWALAKRGMLLWETSSSIPPMRGRVQRKISARTGSIMALTSRPPMSKMGARIPRRSIRSTMSLTR